tara:strand:- start:66 stop:395 length:330 start_codon:yes stop_codon:yes gene_type:complete
MGLDQYAFAIKDDERVELAYWRKHANLQGWMRELYHAKGGTEVDFNCIPVALDNDDLDRLEKEHANLEKATGFFWGSSHPMDDQATADFVSKARDYIRKGYTVEYDSWW